MISSSWGHGTHTTPDIKPLPDHALDFFAFVGVLLESESMRLCTELMPPPSPVGSAPISNSRRPPAHSKAGLNVMSVIASICVRSSQLGRPQPGALNTQLHPAATSSAQ